MRWRIRVAYRQKPEIHGTPESPQSKESRLYILWLLPAVFLAPNLGRIAKWLGFKATYDIGVFVAVAMTFVCIVGGVLAYRQARAQAARDLRELTKWGHQDEIS